MIDEKWKSLILTRGPGSAEFIEANGIGWVIEYKSSALVDLLKYLDSHPDEIAKAAMCCKEIASSHAWAAWARQVIKNLKQPQ